MIHMCEADRNRCICASHAIYSRKKVSGWRIGIQSKVCPSEAKIRFSPQPENRCIELTFLSLRFISVCERYAE